jgi:hypothetical protein
VGYEVSAEIISPFIIPKFFNGPKNKPAIKKISHPPIPVFIDWS